MSQPQTMLEAVERVVEELLSIFDVDHPPVPVEVMLQRPREGMWHEVDLAEMSASFLHMRDPYAPRMSVVRLLARNIVRSTWGEARGLTTLLPDPAFIPTLGRALLLPQRFLDRMDSSALTPGLLSSRFEVPEEDAALRLADLGYNDGRK